MAFQKADVIQAPFTLHQNTSNVTHNNGVSTTNAVLIVKYQVPKGMALGFGGAKPDQKFYFHDTENSSGTDIDGLLEIYKVSPDGDTQKIRLGGYRTERTSASASDKTQMVDVGIETLKVIPEDHWLYIYLTLDTAATYSSTESEFRLDLTQLIPVQAML